HPPWVLICTTGTPSPAIRSASRAVDKSPSMTPTRYWAASSDRVASKKLVLPAPGEPKRFKTFTPCRRNSSRLACAVASLPANTFLWIATITPSLSFQSGHRHLGTVQEPGAGFPAPGTMQGQAGDRIPLPAGPAFRQRRHRFPSQNGSLIAGTLGQGLKSHLQGFGYHVRKGAQAQRDPGNLLQPVGLGYRFQQGEHLLHQRKLVHALFHHPPPKSMKIVNILIY